MKSRKAVSGPGRRVLAVGGIGVLLLCLVPALATFRALEANHSFARIKIEGLKSEADLERVKSAIGGIEGYRRSRLARESPQSTDVWRAELEFTAGSMTEATLRVLEWKGQFQSPIKITVERVTFQTLHLRRPGRGDLAFGVPQSLSADDLNELPMRPETLPKPDSPE